MFLAYLKVLLRHSKRRHRHRAICRSTGIQRRNVIETAGANAAFSSSAIAGSHSNQAVLQQIEAAQMTVLHTTARALTILKST